MSRRVTVLKSLDLRAAPGRPKSASKRRAILEAAKQLFLSQGYERTSLDRIAAAANVSKLTLYSHFRDKSDLHQHALRAHCEELTSNCLPATKHRAVTDRLLAVAHVLFEWLTKPDAIAAQRTIVAAARRLEHVPELYWRAVPQRLFDEIAQMLRREHERGAIAIQHPHQAASQFMSLVKGDLHEHLLFGCVAHLDPQSVAEHLHAAIDVFHRAYAPAPREPSKDSNRRPTCKPSSAIKENHS